jgi:hypothetical protein
MQSTTSAIIRGLSVIIFLFFLSTPLDAQIKIKSHVEIKPDSIQSHQSSINQLKKTSGEKDFVIVPRSGTLIINGTLETMVNPMQGNETMTIFLGGKSYTYNISSPFFELEAQDPFTCRNSDDTTCQLYDYWYYSPNIIFPVHANDTLRLSYSGYSIPYYGYPDEFNDDGYGLFFVPNPVTVGWCSCIWDRIYYIPKLFWIGGSYRTEIMLGESKYLQAYWDDYNQCVQWASGLTDTRNHVDVGVVPPGITFTVESVGGSKCGVYWEQINAEGNPDVNGDMIRLIGRYWEKDSTFAVNVTANCNGKTNTFGSTIYTMAPDRLGSTHNTATDVFGNPFALDSLIIYNAGREGVLPQYLKAIISKETMGLFDPCYRYEPFKDINELQVKNRSGKPNYESMTPYRILNASDKGTPDIPTNHSNVRDASTNRISYPGYTKLWNYYWDHVNFFSVSIYSNSIQEKYWIDERKNFIKEDLKKKESELTTAEQQMASDSADARFFRWLRYECNGGMDNMVAQTRLSASYGLLQLVYYGGREYPQNNAQYRPEDINNHSIGFQYGVKHLIGKFNLKSVLNGHFADPTWPTGLEAKYKRAVGLYNGAGDTYANDVINLVPLFLPQNH